MTAHDLEREFSTRGIRRGPALLLDEKAALALIDRAALQGIAIRAIDQVRPTDLAGYTPLKGSEIRDETERASTWEHARGFVHALAGRELLFEIVLDDHAEGRGAVARGYMTHADTRSALVAALFLMGLITLFVLWANVP
jgi:hypothetical protein